MLKTIKFHILGILFGYPTPSLPMAKLTYSKIGVVYYPNAARPHALYKEWNVAVKTVMPEDRCKNHAAWMLNVMCERGVIIAQIADHEHNESIQRIRAYKERLFHNNRIVSPNRAASNE